MRQDLTKNWLLSALALALLLVATRSLGSEGGGTELETALRETGWEVKRLQDGAIELRYKALASPAGEAAEAIDVAAAEGQESDPEAVAWHRLRESGWRVDKEPDGSTYLYPPIQKSGAKTETVERTSQGEPQTSVTKGLDAQLAERGWRVERAADGSLLLYPRATITPPAPRSSIQPCAGPGSKLAERLKIALPVRRRGQAKVIAESWLTSVGAQGLSVGQIRRILRVFVVSIVDSNPPHALRHQIAINTADGRVIVLN